MTNDMIEWHQIGKKDYAHKNDKKDDPELWATSFSRLPTQSHIEKSLNTKATITYKRPTTAE